MACKVAASSGWRRRSPAWSGDRSGCRKMRAAAAFCRSNGAPRAIMSASAAVRTKPSRASRMAGGVEIHVAGGGGGRGLAEIDEDVAAVVQMGGQEAAAADVAAAGVHD